MGVECRCVTDLVPIPDAIVFLIEPLVMRDSVLAEGEVPFDGSVVDRLASGLGFIGQGRGSGMDIALCWREGRLQEWCRDRWRVGLTLALLQLKRKSDGAVDVLYERKAQVEKSSWRSRGR